MFDRVTTSGWTEDATNLFRDGLRIKVSGKRAPVSPPDGFEFEDADGFITLDPRPGVVYTLRAKGQPFPQTEADMDERVEALESASKGERWLAYFSNPGELTDRWIGRFARQGRVVGFLTRDVERAGGAWYLERVDGNARYFLKPNLSVRIIETPRLDQYGTDSTRKIEPLIASSGWAVPGAAVSVEHFPPTDRGAPAHPLSRKGKQAKKDKKA